MAGALFFALLALAGVLYGSSPGKDKKPHSLPLAVISAVIGSVAILIAFPGLLSVGGALPGLMLLVVGLIGVIAILSAFASPSVPTGPALLIGAALVMWAGFRWLPTGPAAFQYLGTHATAAGNELWDGARGFYHILVGSKPLPKTR